MTSKILLIGGNNSGKTSIALSMASSRPRLYIATGYGLDPEMQKKIYAHKKERMGWDTLISFTLDARELQEVLNHKRYQWVVVDCIGFFVFNCMEKGIEPVQQIKKALEVLQICPNVVVVSNEIGFSPVPLQAYTRKYCKLLSQVNRYLAQQLKTFLVVAGKTIPLTEPPD